MTRLTLVCLGMALITRPAEAHQYHRALSTLSCNAQAGALEVIHRMFAHDLDIVMGDPGDDSRLAEYVAAHFALGDDQGRDIALEWVGSEIRADMVWTYQEAPGLDRPLAVRVRNALLFGALPDQVNTVNVECGGPVQTLVFEKPRKQGVTSGR